MSKNVILTDANSEQILPITTFENVFDDDITLKERFTRLEAIISNSGEWDFRTIYPGGEYVIHNNKLWRSKVKNQGEEPIEGTYWTQVSVASELKDIKTKLGSIGTIANGKTIDGSALGTYVSTTNNTLKSVAQITLGKGVWVVTATSTFKANSTGFRFVVISSTIDADGTRLGLAHPVQTGGTTTINGSVILEVTENSKNFYLNARQTSGGNLDCMVQHFKAVRIA